MSNSENIQVKVFYEKINVPMKVKGHIQKILKEYRAKFAAKFSNPETLRELVFTCVFFEGESDIYRVLLKENALEYVEIDYEEGIVPPVHVSLLERKTL